ncbi:MAG: glycosyltransferase, partial [Alphaproteobacteria bacterium]
SIIAPFNALAYLDDPALHQRCARKFTADVAPDRPDPLRTAGRGSRSRLRIAYLSADYRDHPVARLIAPVLEAHDRSRFEIIGISLGEPGDGEMAARIAAVCDSFHDVRVLTDGQAARLVFDLKTDIAVDLTGHTAQARPRILAHRPAPVQAAYLGYAGTMGAEFIDYIIADPVILPLAEQPFYDEAIIHLPDAYLSVGAAQPAPASAPSRAEAGLPDRGFVFACFNGLWKITPEVFDVWMRLLAKTPGSVLWLYRDTPGAVANLSREAAARGIDPARLIFKDRIDFSRHLALHNLADLFLDTLPYNAHATAVDALAAGLPVLTCQGRSFAGRVGASLLRAAGLPELIADDLVAYEALAVQLAADPEALEKVRSKLARARRTAPLFDPVQFTRGLEDAYETMWRDPRP